MATTGVRTLLALQGSYYLVTGLWPLVSMRSFLWVTGPKIDNLPTGRVVDHWLVNTVAVLILSIAIALLVAAWRREFSASIGSLAIVSAIALCSIDLVYVVRRVIEPIYLLDAAAELTLLGAWAAMLLLGARRPAP
jgi:hypothetical protein